MAEGEEKSRRVSSAELKAKEEHATKAEGEVKARRVSAELKAMEEESAPMAEGGEKSRRVSSDELKAKEEHATKAEGEVKARGSWRKNRRRTTGTSARCPSSFFTCFVVASPELAFELCLRFCVTPLESL